MQEMEAPMNFWGDTVAAISTPYGKGGVGMIRISGPEALAVAEAMFRPQSGRTVGELPDRQATYGKILYKKEFLDDGVLTLYKAPRSFTGENVAEICCHGGVLLTEKVLESALLCGAVPAGAGEFSKRAFLNGKITLSEAEAVIDLINAESEVQLRIAGENSTGALGRRVQEIYEALCRLLASMYAFTDYPDEDLTDLSPKELGAELLNIRKKLENLTAGYRQGHAVMEGLKTVIVGRPNTGKSSLLNGILGKDRAIVSPVAGTTRDTVEEKVRLGGQMLRLCDTAGIRDARDSVERIGVDRAVAAAERASLSLVVLDGSVPLTGTEERIFALAQQAEHSLLLVNKSDLPRQAELAGLADRFDGVCSVCARTGEGVEQIGRLVQALYPQAVRTDGALLTNTRQAEAVGRALAAVDRAQGALSAALTPDAILTDAEEALAALGELTGKSIREDLVATIFSRFCVGK